MQYRIQGARMLTGGKSLFVNLPDKLQEVCKYKYKKEKQVFFLINFFYSLEYNSYYINNKTDT